MEEMMARFTSALNVSKICDHIMMREAFADSTVLDDDHKEFFVRILDGAIDICYDNALEIVLDEIKRWNDEKEAE